MDESHVMPETPTAAQAALLQDLCRRLGLKPSVVGSCANLASAVVATGDGIFTAGELRALAEGIAATVDGNVARIEAMGRAIHAAFRGKAAAGKAESEKRKAEEVVAVRRDEIWPLLRAALEPSAN